MGGFPIEGLPFSSRVVNEACSCHGWMSCIENTTLVGLRVLLGLRLRRLWLRLLLLLLVLVLRRLLVGALISLASACSGVLITLDTTSGDLVVALIPSSLEEVHDVVQSAHLIGRVLQEGLLVCVDVLKSGNKHRQKVGHYIHWVCSLLLLRIWRVTTRNLDLRRVATLSLALRLSDLRLGVLVALITHLGLRRSLPTLVGVAWVSPLGRWWSLPTLVRITVGVHDELWVSGSRLSGSRLGISTMSDGLVEDLGYGEVWFVRPTHSEYPRRGSV